MLLGNCHIGLHEQTRLQPQIQEAMDAPIDDILKKHLHVSLGTGAGRGILQTLVGAVEKPLADLTDVAQDLWERIATRFLMSLALPGGAQLPLGRNIPKDAAARDFLPAALQNMTAPGDLVTLLAQYDRARGATDVGSASVDWRDARGPDELHREPVPLAAAGRRRCSGQPFSDEQRALIEQDKVPGPELGPL